MTDTVTLSGEKSKRIEEKRAEAKKKGKLDTTTSAHWRLVCPACEKPNSLAVGFCTGCGFELCEWDAEEVSGTFEEELNFDFG